MGLNACKSIAQHYNGNIEVESEKDLGTTVKFTF